MHSIVTSRILLHIRRAGVKDASVDDDESDDEAFSERFNFSTMFLGPSSRGTTDYDA